MPARHFPLPWSSEETPACFIARDGFDQTVGLRLLGGDQPAGRRGTSQGMRDYRRYSPKPGTRYGANPKSKAGRPAR
jgi:hypothetical protein